MDAQTQQDQHTMYLDMLYGESWRWGGETRNVVKWPLALVDKGNADILKKVSTPCIEFDGQLKTLVASMTKTMTDNRGVGISAIQIGVPYRVVCVRGNSGITFAVNPRVVASSDEKTSMKEGCLSFPKLFVSVFRPSECEVEYQDLDGQMRKIACEGLEARVFQHEIDHLNGLTMLDRIAKLWQNDAQLKYRQLNK